MSRPPRCCALLRRRPDAGIRVLGLLSDKRDGEGAGVPWLGGLEEIRDVLTSRRWTW